MLQNSCLFPSGAYLLEGKGVGEDGGGLELDLQYNLLRWISRKHKKQNEKRQIWAMYIVTNLQELPMAQLRRVCGAKKKKNGQERCELNFWVDISWIRKNKKMHHNLFQGDNTNVPSKQYSVQWSLCWCLTRRFATSISIGPHCFVLLSFLYFVAAHGLLQYWDQKLWFCATGTIQLSCKKVGVLGWGFWCRIDGQNWPGGFWWCSINRLTSGPDMPWSSVLQCGVVVYGK